MVSWWLRVRYESPEIYCRHNPLTNEEHLVSMFESKTEDTGTKDF
jgi:hypothetical protein